MHKIHVVRASVILTLIIHGLVGASLFAEPVRMVLLSPPTQTTAPGAQLPSPLVVRVERANGDPVPGVQIWYGVNTCVSIPFAIPLCPTFEEYGGFETGELPRPLGVLITTGADGIATAPPYRVGIPSAQHPNLQFGIFPYASTQTTPGGFTITLNDAVNPIGGLSAAMTNVNISFGAAPSAPVLSPVGIAVLSFLILAAAWWKMR